MCALVQKSKDKAAQVVISGGLPRLDNKELHNETILLNCILKKQFKEDARVSIVDNDNFGYVDKGNNKHFTKDDPMHLTKDGTSKLASNIKNMVRTVMNT